jgi:hypothetical protein
MHIIDVGMHSYRMFYYSYVKNFNRNLMKIEFSVLLFTFMYSQKIVKSHVSNYLNIKKINTKFTCN